MEDTLLRNKPCAQHQSLGLPHNDVTRILKATLRAVGEWVAIKGVGIALC